MENIIYSLGFISFILIVMFVVVFKTFRFLYKFNKLYNFFITSTEESVEKRKSFIIKQNGLPPINGECPTTEELKNLK